MAKKDKDFIRIQPIYTPTIWLITTCVFIVLLFLEQILGWEKAEVGYAIIWYIFMGGIALVSFAIFIYYCQFACIDKSGIKIRGVFYKIVEIKWNEIYSINKESVVTYDNRTNVSLKWLIIRLNKNDSIVGRAGRNRRNKFPYYIIATKRNIEIIGQYFQIN